MPDAGYHYRRIPRRVQGRIEELVSALVRLAGDDLVAVVLIGGLARGEWHEDSSDIDLCVVLSRGDRALYTKMGEHLAVARAAARVDATLLLESEIARASDVFPLWFDDMRAHRHVLVGRDPFAALEVKGEHRRLQIEQELREAALALRGAATGARGDRALLSVAVQAALRKVRLPLHALLTMLGSGTESHDLDIVLAGASKRFQVDASRFVRALDVPEPAFDELVVLCERAASAADALETAAGA